MTNLKNITKQLKPLSKVVWRGRQRARHEGITRSSKFRTKIRPVTRNLEEKRLRVRLRQAWRSRGDIVAGVLPLWGWVRNYRASDLSGDVLAGTIVAIMLMPQSMAYAMLAGLPPQIGLYTAVLPLILYAIFGTSRTLGVGPVAIVSLMVAHSLAPMAQAGTPEYIGLAILLALLSGLVLILAGFLRLGFLTNFIGHPVVAGFSTAAALIIGFSQLKHLLGVSTPNTENIVELIKVTAEHADKINAVTLLISLLGLVVMMGRNQLRAKLREMGFSEEVSSALPKGMALLLVVLSALYVWWFHLDTGNQVAIVGDIPAGLPSLVVPEFNQELWQKILPMAGLIAVVGYIESLSIAKTLATRKRQKINPNQELVGLGIANVGAALSGGYPITGSFSRSVVNFTSGANTQLAAIISALLIALVLIFFTPLLYYIPKATLAVIIVMAVATLVDFSPLVSAWNYYKPDGAAFAVTFVAVLLQGVEIGIMLGIALSVGMYLWRSSRPHMPVLGRIGNTETFRSVERHKVRTYDKVLIIRVDDNLYFANAAYLEDRLQAEIADRPKIKHVVLVMESVTLVDASALETMTQLVESYRGAGVLIHLASVKGPLMDMLERAHFLLHLSPGNIYMSPHDAVLDLVGEDRSLKEVPSAPTSGPAGPAGEKPGTPATAADGKPAEVPAKAAAS